MAEETKAQEKQTTDPTKLEKLETTSESDDLLKKQASELADLKAKHLDLVKQSEATNQVITLLKEKGLLDETNKPKDVDGKLSLAQKEIETVRQEKEKMGVELGEMRKEIALAKRDKSIAEWAKENSKEGKVYDVTLIIGLLHSEIPDKIEKRIAELEKNYPSIARAEKDNGPKPNNETAKNKGDATKSAIDRAIAETVDQRKKFSTGFAEVLKQGHA